MGSFPPSVTQAPPDGGNAPGGAPASGGGSPAIKLTMLGQLIEGLAQQFPQGQQGIQMMLKGLRMVQASAAAGSAPQQPAAPPR
ncbi:MAG TPA: hypothetical protein VN666_21860 [Nitrospira sp.]|nr:hypothetical protein [Nitrospira sp.]